MTFAFIPLRAVAISLILSTSAFAAGGVLLPLWPEGVPGAKSLPTPESTDPTGLIAHVSEPTLEMFAPSVDRANGTALIICPGGGYSRLVYRREGTQYANWLTSLGVTAFVLKYRLNDFGHPAPLQDVLRAIRLVRSQAKEFDVDPTRIGVIGSSAGGHLAGSAATLFDHADGRTGAKLDEVSARPDFAILLYPVITMEGPATHPGSRDSLLGPHPTAEAKTLLSLERQVTATTPPILIIHTQKDQVVPVENSLSFYSALTKAGVPAEIYVFETGPHGVSLKPDLGTTSSWPSLAEAWLSHRGLLRKAKP